MSKNIVALILAAGAGALVYSVVGKRLGYGNVKSIWSSVIGAFVLVYIILLISFTWVIHIK